jgi:hypothetical protein
VATQNLASADSILKNVYRGTIVELLNQETYIIDQLEKTNANNMGSFNGRQLVFAVHSGRNRGRGAHGDGGTLATAGSQAALDGIVTMKSFDQAIELSDQLIRQTKANEGAFVNALTWEMDGAATDLRKDISRQAYGTGDGLLATVNTTTSGAATVTVDTGQYIGVGDTVDVLVKSSGATITNGTAVQVTAVSYTGAANSVTQTQAQLTLSGGNVSVTNGTHGVYLSGDRNLETDGLGNIIATGRTLHQINSSTYPIWDSNVLSAGQANPSEDLFMQLAQKMRKRSGKGPDLFLTSLGVQRRLANTYTSQKRYNDAQAIKIDGGYSAIMVAAGNEPVPVVSDVDAPEGVAFGLRKDSFAWAELDKPDWLEAPDGNGGVLHLKDGATAGTKVRIWQAWMVWDATLTCIAPLRNGKITGFNDDIPEQRI